MMLDRDILHSDTFRPDVLLLRSEPIVFLFAFWRASLGNLDWTDFVTAMVLLFINALTELKYVKAQGHKARAWILTKFSFLNMICLSISVITNSSDINKVMMLIIIWLIGYYVFTLVLCRVFVILTDVGWDLIRKYSDPVGWEQKRRLLMAGKCSKCEYDITGNTTGKCPECGTPISSDNSSVETESR